jgi:hypothetical protein
MLGVYRFKYLEETITSNRYPIVDELVHLKEDGHIRGHTFKALGNGEIELQIRVLGSASYIFHLAERFRAETTNNVYVLRYTYDVMPEGFYPDED